MHFSSAALFGLPFMFKRAGPSVLDPNLGVRTVIAGLDQPTSMAFLGAQRLSRLGEGHREGSARVNGVVQSTCRPRGQLRL